MKTKTLIFLLSAMIGLVSCNHDEPGTAGTDISGLTVAYAIDGQEGQRTVGSEAEWDELLDSFCQHAVEGSSVTFCTKMARSKISDAAPSGSGVATFSTDDRQQMKEWMKEQEKAGKTVNVTYDDQSGTWNGTAYAIAPVSSQQQANCYTGVIAFVPMPPLTEPALPGLVKALVVNADSTLIIAEHGMVDLYDDPTDETYPEGETVTLCGTVTSDTALDGSVFYLIDIAQPDASALVGTWQVASLAVMPLAFDNYMLHTSVYVPGLMGETASYQFEADGTVTAQQVNLVDGTVVSSATGTWTLDEGNSLCIDLNDGDSEASHCWAISWMGNGALVLTRVDSEADGDVLYQLEFITEE